ncbi:MAG: hypothetical protein EPN43_03300 [Jatrophihabitans sp.]|nr:MAG: hypothetical protein EPN43_03300 [Jatrophihabitans sp.]
MNRAALAELAPMLRRALDLGPDAVARVRADGGTVTAFVRLPFAVLVSRTVADADADAGAAADADAGAGSPGSDGAYRIADLLAWLDAGAGGAAPVMPPPHDLLWRGTLPPATGWRRLEQVPDGEIRRVVRAAAITLKEAADREGISKAARLRTQAADAVLDAVGLTVDGAGMRVQIPVRALTALTRMGFLARDSHARVDACGGWVRVVGRYGNVYVGDRDRLTVRPADQVSRSPGVPGLPAT